ncbi:hypothetical protein PC112_g23774, partial [Phytophthora cactorum]
MSNLLTDHFAINITVIRTSESYAGFTTLKVASKLKFNGTTHLSLYKTLLMKIERRRNGFKDFTVRSVVITTDRLNAAGGIKLQVRSIA